MFIASVVTVILTPIATFVYKNIDESVPSRVQLTDTTRMSAR